MSKNKIFDNNTMSREEWSANSFTIRQHTELVTPRGQLNAYEKTARQRNAWHETYSAPRENCEFKSPRTAEQCMQDSKQWRESDHVMHAQDSTRRSSLFEDDVQVTKVRLEQRP